MIKLVSQHKVRIRVKNKYYSLVRFSLVAQLVKNLPAMQETLVQSLGWEDPLEEGMATHSSILAWRIPMDTGYSPWGHKELDMTERLSAAQHIAYYVYQ